MEIAFGTESHCHEICFTTFQTLSRHVQQTHSPAWTQTTVETPPWHGDVPQWRHSTCGPALAWCRPSRSPLASWQGSGVPVYCQRIKTGSLLLSLITSSWCHRYRRYWKGEIQLRCFVARVTKVHLNTQLALIFAHAVQGSLSEEPMLVKPAFRINARINFNSNKVTPRSVVQYYSSWSKKEGLRWLIHEGPFSSRLKVSDLHFTRVSWARHKKLLGSRRWLSFVSIARVMMKQGQTRLQRPPAHLGCLTCGTDLFGEIPIKGHI